MPCPYRQSLFTGELHCSLQEIPCVIIVLMDMRWGPSQLRWKRVLDQRRAPLRLLASGKARGPRGTDLTRACGDSRDVLHPSPRCPREHEILLRRASARR
jgi:hypothetical protein